jgi:galactose mutarotase-like enzyme
LPAGKAPIGAPNPADKDFMKRSEQQQRENLQPQRPRCELHDYSLPGIPTTPLVWLADEACGTRVGVLPAAGGEITSLQIRRRSAWHELLHRAMNYEAWPCEAAEERAPLLWPAVGRSFTAEQTGDWGKIGIPPLQNRYKLNGTTYNIDVHGFARKLPWRLDGSGTTETTAYARCTLSSSVDTLKIYPFNFELSVTYRVSGGRIALEYEVLAGENPFLMPFSIGNHLSLRIPFTGKGQFAECTLRSPGSLILHQNPLCLLSGESTSVDLSRPTSLDRKDLLDTVVGGFERDQVWLELRDPSSLRLRIVQRELNVDGKFRASEEDFFFVFWGDTAAGYFCPEPWIGKPNSLNTGEGCIRLESGQRFLWEISLEPGFG